MNLSSPLFLGPPVPKKFLKKRLSQQKSSVEFVPHPPIENQRNEISRLAICRRISDDRVSFSRLLSSKIATHRLSKE